jgi:hypothetical protein
MRIAERGPAARGAGASPRFLDVVQQTYPPAHSRQLEGILRTDGGYDTCVSRAFVYAETIPRGQPALWPVLAFSAQRASRQLKVRAALFFEGTDDSDAGRPLATGWRFEPPEGAVGAHAYYHAQPITAWDTSGNRKLPVKSQCNEVFPAFPLKAEDSISLLTGVLVSLYGKTSTQAILAEPQLRRVINPVRSKIEAWL